MSHQKQISSNKAIRENLAWQKRNKKLVSKIKKGFATKSKTKSAVKKRVKARTQARTMKRGGGRR